MSKVVADISMSLDGFVTGPNPDLADGLGQGGEPLHAWAFSGNQVDADVLRENVEATGAVVMGRRLFDFVDGPNGWSMVEECLENKFAPRSMYPNANRYG